MDPKAEALRCEYQTDPLGIDCPSPRFSWQMRQSARGARQTAYRILAATTAALLAQNTGDCWDSGVCQSSKSIHVRYAGRPLKSMRRYFWKVQVADDQGVWSAFSAPATFVTGVLDPKDWQTGWLGFSGGANGAAILARRPFELSERPLEAIACVTGVGYYEFSVNGKKVGDHVLDPAPTDYTKRVLYATYDITPFLRPGANVCGFHLGNGWHGAPRFCAQIVLRFPDGRQQLLTTAPDTGWQMGRSPIRQNSIFDGEFYDARLEKDGWDTPHYDFSAADRRKGGWIHAMSLEAPGGILTAQTMDPIRVVRRCKVSLIHTLTNGDCVYDAGYNLAGWISLRVRGARGARVTLRHGEMLYPDGAVNQENLRTACAEDCYVLRGGKEETYVPRFTYHGFRYVQLSIEGEVEVLAIEAQQVRSDVRTIGTFSCSDACINGIEKMVVRTEENNFHGIPTDCPQRDERMGWLNDATVRMEEAVYHFDLAAFLEKWMWDIRDTQAPDGSITDTAPFRFGTRPADPVCSSFLLIPWLLLLHYGDDTCLRTHYDAMKAWVGYLGTMAQEQIIHYSRFGDWASPRSESEDTAFGSGARSATTPGDFMSTGYYYYDAVLMERFALHVGQDEDARFYQALAQRLRAAFLSRYYDPQTGRYAQGSQGAQAFALMLGLTPDEGRELVLKQLLQEVKRHNYHLSTGNQTTKYLLEQLSEHGHSAEALRIATQMTYPGWGYMLKQGATTVWERWEWETGKEMNSHDHPMHGAISAWFFNTLAGIRPLQTYPGFKRFLLKPCLTCGLKHAGARLASPYGPLCLYWEYAAQDVRLAVSVPENTSAELRLPSGMIREGNSPYSEAPSFDGLLEWGNSAQELYVHFGAGNYVFHYQPATGSAQPRP